MNQQVVLLKFQSGVAFNQFIEKLKGNKVHLPPSTHLNKPQPQQHCQLLIIQMKLLKIVVQSLRPNDYLVHMWHHSVLQLNRFWFQHLLGLVATVLIDQFEIKIEESVEDAHKKNTKYMDKVVQKKEKRHHKLNWMFKNEGAKRVKSETALGIHRVSKKLWCVEEGGWRNVQSLEQMILPKILLHR